MEFRIPSRGLIGFRTEFLTDTRGTGHHEPPVRRLRAVARATSPHRTTGALVADRAGARHRLRASSTCRSAASCSSSPGDEVYEGMIVGENARDGRHGRQHHQGEEAHQHARLDRRRGASASCRRAA
ncbi:MAG: hypothetical protein MZV49_15650 [Rhodopseudomonas palustris]|nr:hypothetical protein [Rhodopseudomonas palustris]